MLIILGMTPGIASAADEIGVDGGVSDAGVSDTSNSDTENSGTGDSDAGNSNTGNPDTEDSGTEDSGTGSSDTGDSKKRIWDILRPNTGNSNTGDAGTGDSETEDSSSGDAGTGDSGTGDSGTGDSDTGSSDTEDSKRRIWDILRPNTGNSNTGDAGTGDSGTGDSETEDSSSGDSGTEDSSSGDSGTEDSSSGDSGTGDPGTEDSDAGTGDSETEDSDAGDAGTGGPGTEDSDAGDSGAGDSNTGDSGTGGSETEGSGAGDSETVNPDNWNNEENKDYSSGYNPGSTSGSSSIGSGVSTEPARNIAVKELATRNIISGYHIRYDFPEKVTCIMYIEYDAERTLRKTTTTVEVLKDKSTLVPILPPGEIYKHVNIWVGEKGGGLPTSLKNGVVGFKVEKAWIEENNINESFIILQRYNKGWKPLDTEKIEEDLDYVYFESKTPGYSFFAITEYDEEENEKGLQKNLRSTDDMDKNPMSAAKMFLSLALPLFMFFAGYCILKRKI